MHIQFDTCDPVNRAFWLGALHLARLPELDELAQDPAALEATFDELWSDRVDRAVADELIAAWGPEVPGRRHLVALAWFMEDKGLRALKDAAAAALDEDLLRSHPAMQARWHRLAAAALLLRHSPEALADVYLWDVYHPRARAALKLAGQPRKLGSPLPVEPWTEHAEGALDALGRARTRRGLRFHHAVARPWRDDVLLAFREHGRADTHRDAADQVAPGWRDEWTFLRVYDHGARIDVTSRDPERAKALAAAVGSRLFRADVSYKHARDPLTGERLNEFLGRLLDPDDPVFSLHEMASAMDGYDDRPHAVLRRWGGGRVEEVACEMRDAHGFGRDWTLVDYAKIAFFDEDGTHHRMAVYFPEATDLTKDLALSFQDHGVNTDVSSRFAARLQGELGVEVHPRVSDPSRTRRTGRAAGKPARLSVSEWRAALASRLDEPAPWQRAMLEEVESLGIVHVTRETVFRCGDTRIPAAVRPVGSIGCAGEVTMPYGSVSTEDAFIQDPDETFRCDAADHDWKLAGYKPPCILRVRTRVDLPRATAWLRKQLGAARWEEDETGVFTKVVPGRGRRTLILLDEADATWRDAEGPRLAWISLDNRADLRRYGDRALGIAHFVADGVAAVARAYGDDPEVAVSLVAEPPGPTYDARPVVEPGEAGILVGGRVAIPRTQPRFRLLLALLQAWQDAHLAGQAPYARVADLAGLDESGSLSGNDVHGLLHALRKDLGPAAKVLIDDPGGRVGVRLCPGLRAVGFDLNEELIEFKDRKQNPREK